MPPTNQEAIDIIATQILFDAKSALISLKKFNDNVDNSAVKVKVLKELISSTASKMGGDLKGATNAVSKFANSFTGINPSLVRSVGKELQNVGEKGEGAGNQMKTAFDKTFTAVNATRIALGALVSMILFNVLQSITQFFSSAIEQAREFEATLYRISNAERQLSMEGIEVTVKGLKEGIEDIKDALPIFAKEDVAQLVGSVATTTKELGLTEDQILSLSAAIGILNINSTETETLLQTQAKVTNSLLSPQAKSIGNLGLSFGKAKLEAKAFELGILSVGKSFKDLTEKQKTELKYRIVLETAGIEGIPLSDLREEIQKAGGDFEALNEYLQSNDARLQENAAAWNDLKVTFGQALLPFLPAVTEFFNFINIGLIMTKALLVEVLTRVGAFGVVVKQAFAGNIKSLQDFTNALKESTDILRTDLVNTFFKEVPENAPDFFMRAWGDKIKGSAETATGAIQDLYDTTEDSEDAQKALEDLDQKIQDIILDAKQAQEDLDLKLEQKQGDLELEYNRKAEDAARDHAQKLEDINQDALDKIEDAKRKAREEEKKSEQDLLQKLKELRNKFLMDLEDALRARDARQVLRLIKEYKNDKQNILDRAKLDKQQRKDSLEADLAAIELERKRRIESEQIEYARKLADLNAAKAREQADLLLWYQREQEDIQRNIEQKLQRLLNGYITEGKLHEEHQAEIYATLLKYFGKDKELVDRLASYMAQRFAEMRAMASMPIAPNDLGIAGYSALNAPVSNYGLGGGTLTATASGGVSRNSGRSSRTGTRRAFAEGGTLVATKPTLALFGETPEIATFKPINRTGRDANKVFGDLNGIGGGGSLGVKITLSPELRAEIIEQAMDGVAVTIDHARRER